MILSTGKKNICFLILSMFILLSVGFNETTTGPDDESTENYNIWGYTYYAGTKIPIVGVLVAVGEISCLTAAYGSFRISDLPKGYYTLTATKKECTVYCMSSKHIGHS